uniref:Nucleotid_trans domain-containing protein n=3 Tax=Caenorhabditis japonica TaxID=281687 RepID=A0A8R1ISV5_CAEJA
MLREKYPAIPSVVVDLNPLKESVEEDVENRRYIIYQIILLMRARICASFALRGINFWAMQQDTLWVENFESMNLEDRYPNDNLIFDTVGNDQITEYKRMHGWICGSTFFVRGNAATHQFFMQVKNILLLYMAIVDSRCLFGRVSVVAMKWDQKRDSIINPRG